MNAVTAQKHHYTTLGIEPRGRAWWDIPLEEIHAAFRQRGRLLHPDGLKARGAPEALIKQAEKAAAELGEAYATLTNPRSRADYHSTMGLTNGIEAGVGVPVGHPDYNRLVKDNIALRTGIEHEVKRLRDQGEQAHLDRRFTTDKNYKGLDLEGCKFTGDIHQVDFRSANLQKADFSGRHITDSLFDNATRLDGANFCGSTLQGIQGLPSHMEQVNFENVRKFKNTSLAGKTFDRCRFDRAEIPQADFNGAQFIGTSMDHADLRGAQFGGAVFERGSLKKSWLDNAVFHNAVFKDMACEGVDLSKSHLQGAQFHGPLKGLILGEHQLAHIDVSAAEREGVTILDHLGKPAIAAMEQFARKHDFPVPALISTYVVGKLDSIKGMVTASVATAEPVAETNAKPPRKPRAPRPIDKPQAPPVTDTKPELPRKPRVPRPKPIDKPQVPPVTDTKPEPIKPKPVRKPKPAAASAASVTLNTVANDVGRDTRNFVDRFFMSPKGEVHFGRVAAVTLGATAALGTATYLLLRANDNRAAEQNSASR